MLTPQFSFKLKLLEWRINISKSEITSPFDSHPTYIKYRFSAISDIDMHDITEGKKQGGATNNKLTRQFQKDNTFAKE